MKNLLKYLSAILALTALTTASAKKDDDSSSHLGRESFYFEALADVGLHSRNTITGTAVPATETEIEAKHKALFGGQAEIGMTQDSFRVGLNFSYNRANSNDFQVTTLAAAAADNTVADVKSPDYRREYFSYMIKGYYDMALSEDLDAFFGLGLGAASVRVGAIALADHGVNADKFSKTLFTWGLDLGLAWHATEQVDLVAKYGFQYIPGFDIKGVEAGFNRSLLHSICVGVRFHM